MVGSGWIERCGALYEALFKPGFTDGPEDVFSLGRYHGALDAENSLKLASCKARRAAFLSPSWSADRDRRRGHSNRARGTLIGLIHA